MPKLENIIPLLSYFKTRNIRTTDTDPKVGNDEEDFRYGSEEQQP